MDINLEDLFESGYTVELKEIQFESAQYKKAKISLWDEIKLQSVNKKEVIFEFSRIVKTVPKSTINLKIKFLLGRKLRHEEDSENIKWEEFISNLSEDELDALGGNIYSRESLLIAQITSSDGGSPLITAPVPYIKKIKI